jgi:hypothetical protein
MTREEIEIEAKNQYTSWNERAAFMSGANFVLRTQLEKKRDAYIHRIGYEPDHKDLENWNLQIDLLNKKIDEL